LSGGFGRKQSCADRELRWPLRLRYRPAVRRHDLCGDRTTAV